MLLSVAALLAGCGSSASGSGATPTPTGGKPPTAVPRVRITPAGAPTAPPLPTATAIAASAYTATLTGTVTDAKTGAPIPGAVVVIAGGAKTARTNAFGVYRVRFPAGHTAPVTIAIPGFAGALAMGQLKSHQIATLNFKLNPITAGAPPLPSPPIRFGQP